MGRFIFGLSLAISGFYTWSHSWGVAFWLALRYGVNIDPDLLGIISFIAGVIGSGLALSGAINMVRGNR